MWRRALILVLVSAGMSMAWPARADDPPPAAGPAAVDACDDLAGDVSPKTCRSVLQLTRAGSHLCRTVPGSPPELCAQSNGLEISEAQVAEYEASKVHKALAKQRRKDGDTPLRHVVIPATHNSYNSAAYTPTLSGLDHNQLYSLTDQLRMDMRGLELDVHWAPSATGDPAHGGRAPILCHGQEVDLGGAAAVHAGCTTERDLRDGLKEIAAWLERNPGELVLIYLENALDDDPVAHDVAASRIEEVLGDLVYRPATECAPMPTDLTPNQILATGSQVLLVGNCGAGGDWGSWVFERDQEHGTWVESSSGGEYDCEADRAVIDYERSFVRYFEDSTWLSAMADGTGLGGPSEITAEETAEMARCGVNLFGFDQLHPDDPRLAALAGVKRGKGHTS